MLCHAKPATKVFLPCEHACVCMDCMDEHKIGPYKESREKKKVGTEEPLPFALTCAVRPRPACVLSVSIFDSRSLSASDSVVAISMPLLLLRLILLYWETSQDGEKSMWSACPVCMARIEAIISAGKISEVPRNYGPAAKLPPTFAQRFKASVVLLPIVPPQPPGAALPNVAHRLTDKAQRGGGASDVGDVSRGGDGSGDLDEGASAGVDAATVGAAGGVSAPSGSASGGADDASGEATRAVKHRSSSRSKKKRSTPKRSGDDGQGYNDAPVQVDDGGGGGGKGFGDDGSVDVTSAARRERKAKSKAKTKTKSVKEKEREEDGEGANHVTLADLPGGQDIHDNSASASHDMSFGDLGAALAGVMSKT